MIEGIKMDDSEMFGLYELDDSGNVLYSRMHDRQHLAGSNGRAVGQNFFLEVAKFENREDLRQHFRRFVAGTSPADNFKFECLFGSRTVRTRIFMTRGHESDSERTAGIVIMDIRGDGN